MMKPVCFKLLCYAILAGACSCMLSSNDGSIEEPRSKIALDLYVDRNPQYLETARVTCRYRINHPSDRSDTFVFVAKGYFFDPMPIFEIVSGESSWVDTIASFETKEHYIDVKALKRGQYLIEAGLYARMDSTWDDGDVALLMLNVR